ncbi:hypothetical protein CONLIGDRAFT_13631 [Coniochaeta ligniaria NRRL 30616]|uniref:Uncharacterized protein n=1 Tax=Coniochaeta ligniaria NRRL 30616 TaxID=1408157 RepID=A0A1J7J5E9_9PEZI|nr:hypothetical protein CONLIGDRAFT_13631 [Coniochaeta ligniaria NRRL 30616]
MAANFDKLEKSFDKLERLFSKRRKGSLTHEPAVRGNKHHDHTSPSHSPSPTLQPNSDPQIIFPSPSFLRPTTTRMLARDEVTVTVKSPRRAQSLPETPNSHGHGRMPSIDESISASVSPLPTVTSYPKVPKRSSSLAQRRRDPSIASLLEFSFAEKHTRARNASVRASGTEPASPRRTVDLSQIQELDQIQELSRLQDALPIFSGRRPDTPPYSDSGDCTSPSPTYFNKPLPRPPSAFGVSTPEPSPQLLPIVALRPIHNLLYSGMIAELKSQKHRSLGALEMPRAGAVSLRKTVSDSTLSKTAPAPQADFLLEEPTVETFLSMSDDDIADGPPVTPPPRRLGSGRFGSGRAPTFDLPPDPPVFQMPSPRSGSSRTTPLICLSSPLTSRPAKAAAFECQRIAARFKFDLIYIVNLWPENIGHTSSAIPCPGESLGSPRRVRRRTPSHLPRRNSAVTGRLLAGHGLANVQTPFMISPEVHTKVLRQDGWLEYRSERISHDEFSNGYSCAFYAGVSSDGRRAEKPDDPNIITLSEKRRSQQLKNRGIVFAAYRLPNPDGTTLYSDKAQLNALHQEAETLVEMLLDIHKTNRSKYPTEKPDTDETGPLPVRPKYSPYHS